MTALSRFSQLSLREVTEDTVRTVCNLSLRPDQQRFVAPNAVSIAQAYFADHAWFRAVYAGETPVGFLMLSDLPQKPEYYLWRFMIDARYQGLGFGARAIALLVDHVRPRPGARELLTSVVEGDGSPRPFYEKLGFTFTGEYDEDEAVLRLSLEDRVLLRDVRDGDLPVLFEHQRDPEAVRMVAFPSREPEAFTTHWDRIRADASNRSRTILRDGQVAGHVASFERFGMREVGYWIGRSHWGRGVATRALAAFLRDEAHRPLVARVAEHNAGSIRVLQKCGFQPYTGDPGPAPEDGVTEVLMELRAS